MIVTGEGRGFCAGADLARGAETFDYDNQDSDAQAERASNEGRQEGENSWLRDGGDCFRFGSTNLTNQLLPLSMDLLLGSESQ